MDKEEVLDVKDKVTQAKVKVRDEKYITKNFTEIERYILESIISNDRPKLELCLQYVGEYDLNKCVNSKGTSILHYAVSTGRDTLSYMVKANNIIHCLVRNGAKLEALDNDGLSPYDYAKIKGFWNNMETLTYLSQLPAKRKLRM